MNCGDSSLRLATDWKVPAGRLDVEVAAIHSSAVAEACRQEPSVQILRILRRTDNGYIMNWAGEMTLFNACKTYKLFDAEDVGSWIVK